MQTRAAIYAKINAPESQKQETGSRQQVALRAGVRARAASGSAASATKAQTSALISVLRAWNTGP